MFKFCVFTFLMLAENTLAGTAKRHRKAMKKYEESKMSASLRGSRTMGKRKVMFLGYETLKLFRIA